MTKVEWESIVEAAISEAGIKATVNMCECTQGSQTCFATVWVAKTGEWIEVRADSADGTAKMQESVVLQLRAKKSN